MRQTSWLFSFIILAWATSAAAQSPVNTNDGMIAPNDDFNLEDKEVEPTPEEPKTKEKPKKEPALSLADWERTDWALVKPEKALVEVTGYFRARSGTFRKLNFGNNGYTEQDGDAGRRYPLNDGGNANTSYTDMRLRIMPKMNISDNISVMMTFDVMDNLVLGSTPTNFPDKGGPIETLSTGQLTGNRASRDPRDMLVAKHAYVRMTALNEQLELRVGRMPDHWGMGMLYNSGMCIDCDFDRSVDRAAVSFRLAGHTIALMFDWVGTGPSFYPFGADGPGVDGVIWNDAQEYGLRVHKEDHPDDIREKVLQGKTVLNYGMHNGIRVQKSGVSGDPVAVGTDVTKLPTEAQKESRDALLYTGDGYLKLHHRNFQLGIEAAIQVGSFKDKIYDVNLDPQKTKILMYGFALESKYTFTGVAKGTLLSFKSGMASGDKAPGFGALSRQSNQRYAGGDSSINNFQFSPNYTVGLDMLVYRRIIGTVTDTFYIRPAVSYDFNEDFSGEIAMLYSQAVYGASTPSCTAANTGDSVARTGCKTPMALEFDAEVSYGLAKTYFAGKTQRLRASLVGALAVPFGAFTDTAGKSPSLAWMIQGRMFVTF